MPTDGAFTYGSLFSGIGGMDLGLDRAGMTCRWQCEIDPFARLVLAKHWPDVPKHDDVKTFPPTQPEDWSVDLIAGGFPCQDISYAGLGAGINGARSGLWFEYARIIREIRPRYVLVENVAALLTRGLDAVLGTLASLGYDSEWQCIPASFVGAPHIRERVFIFSYPKSSRRDGAATVNDMEGSVSAMHGRTHVLQPGTRGGRMGKWPGDEPGRVVRQSGLGRMADGFPRRMDRLRGFGNAVVPQVAEWIGHRILEHAGRSDANP